jgi:DNA-directed RNA polymerase specialized sigma24 family protein
MIETWARVLPIRREGPASVAPREGHDVSSAGSVSNWIAQVKAGDELALAKLHQRYWPALVGLARQRLQGSPIPSDEEDIAQQAFLGFYHAVKSQRVPRLENRHQFLALLSHIISCKACNQVTHELTARKGGGRVQQGSAMMRLAQDSANSPLEEAILKDCYQKYVGDIPENLRPCAELFLQGYSRQEIAAQIGRADRTVDRKLVLLRQYWQSIAEQCLTHDISEI